MNDIVSEIRGNSASLNKLYNLMNVIVGPNNFDATKSVNYLRYKLGLNDSAIHSMVF